MPLDLFYTMVQKSQKRPKTQIKGGGSCLKVACARSPHLQAKKFELVVSPLSNGATCDRRTKNKNDQMYDFKVVFPIEKWNHEKLSAIEKRLCVIMRLLEVINTTKEKLQTTKHKSVRWIERERRLVDVRECLELESWLSIGTGWMHLLNTIMHMHRQTNISMNNVHQANPHVHQHHVVGNTTFWSGLPAKNRSRLSSPKSNRSNLPNGYPARFIDNRLAGIEKRKTESVRYREAEDQRRLTTYHFVDGITQPLQRIFGLVSVRVVGWPRSWKWSLQQQLKKSDPSRCTRVLSFVRSIAAVNNHTGETGSTASVDYASRSILPTSRMDNLTYLLLPNMSFLNSKCSWYWQCGGHWLRASRHEAEDQGRKELDEQRQRIGLEVNPIWFSLFPQTSCSVSKTITYVDSQLPTTSSHLLFPRPWSLSRFLVTTRIIIPSMNFRLGINFVLPHKSSS